LKILNIHLREINASKEVVSKLFETLGTTKDQIWPLENWPAMRLKNGLNTGSKGGHGPIKYFVKEYITDTSIEFVFLKPTGFKGTHIFEISELDKNTTLVKHTIKMKVFGKALFLWIFAIRPLHDALLEDAFDKVENQFTSGNKKSKWNLWVLFLRKIMSPKKQKTPQ